MEISGYIPSGSDALYATLYQPDENASDCGLVLVPPFGQEAKSTVRVYTRLARRLVTSGHACIRFDLRGTGDSTGDHAAVTLQHWLADIQSVMQTVTAGELPNGRHARWGLLGVRLGATLAAQVAPAVNAAYLALLEPVPNGSAYLEDLLRRRAIRAAMSGSDGQSEQADPRAEWDAGGCVDFGAFPVNAQLARDLRGCELGTALTQLGEAMPIGLFRVAATERLTGPWGPLFEAVDTRRGGTAEVLRDKPFWGQIEYYESDVVLERINRWLSAIALESTEQPCTS